MLSDIGFKGKRGTLTLGNKSFLFVGNIRTISFVSLFDVYFSSIPSAGIMKVASQGVVWPETPLNVI